MRSLNTNRFLRVLALFALLLFAGDLAADAIADLSQGHCTSATSSSAPCDDKVPCSHCACATHAGAVVIAEFAMRLSSDLEPASLLQACDEATPPRLAASIDHPPQLA